MENKQINGKDFAQRSEQKPVCLHREIMTRNQSVYNAEAQKGPGRLSAQSIYEVKT